MAASLQRDDDELAEAHEINVTPFIDVILVLLIIFMVAAPLSTVDVAVDLPVSTATPQPRPDKPLFLSVQKDLQLSLGDETVFRENLGAALDQATKGDKNARIFLRADQIVEYGALMEVMNLLRKAGYLKVALVGLESIQPKPTGPAPQTSPEENAAGSRP
jgi:biopolymer transport protein ExbD